MTPLELTIHIFKPFVISMAIAAMFYAVVRGWKSLFSISRGSWDSGLKNITIVIFNSTLLMLFLSGFAGFIKSNFASWMPVVPAENWGNVPFIISLLISLIAYDFANYWSHRILHLRPYWGLHALHHSDEHMNWTTAHRVHIFEYLQMIACAVFIIGWLQLPTEAAALAGGIRMWYIKYTHCQLGWNHGPLTRIFVSPNLHRWHHANVEAAYGKNLGDMFAIWDVMFGTYYNPGPCTAELGVDEVPDNIFLQQLYPVQYWADQAKALLKIKPQKII